MQQCSGEWDARDSNMASYHFLIQKLSGSFEGSEFLHVLREENEVADTLTKITSSRQSIPVPEHPAAPQAGPRTAQSDPGTAEPGPGAAQLNPAAITLDPAVAIPDPRAADPEPTLVVVLAVLTAPS